MDPLSTLETAQEEARQNPLNAYLMDKSPERRDIFELLKQRPWFRQTALNVQIELATLPETPQSNFNGFLKDLAARPDKISNVTVVSLERIARGNFAIIPVFNVVNEQGNNYTYEYVSWRYGPQSGIKGLVLIESEGEVSHFVVLKGDKFATGKTETDSVGGFIDLNIDGVTKAIDRVTKEAQEELGLPELKLIREPLDLGQLCVDPGMTNNRPGIFIASIDAHDAKGLKSEPINSDPYELSGKVIVYPISQLADVVLQNDDSFFLACVARAWAKGVLPHSVSKLLAP